MANQTLGTFNSIFHSVIKKPDHSQGAVSHTIQDEMPCASERTVALLGLLARVSDAILRRSGRLVTFVHASTICVPAIFVVLRG